MGTRKFSVVSAVPKAMATAIAARKPDERPAAGAHGEMDALLRGDRRARPRGEDRRSFPRRRVELMGLPVDQLTESDTVETVLRAVKADRGGCLFTPNLQHVQAFHAGRDAAVYEDSAALPGARLVVADGMPLIWASRLRGTPLPERVAGSNLIFSLTRAAADSDASIFLLGGNRGAAEACAERMLADNPQLRITGFMCPPPGFEKDAEMMDEIARTLRVFDADIVYVALGFPKQEQLALQLSREFPSTWFVGVGISFSFVGGDVKRAPRWMQATGLEWLHRLMQEPRRLFRRYVVDGLPFAARLFAQAIGRRMRRAG
jgi:N-acetylglucosaminyldiphosphoundecaprenol N-acetyl-beta-D-mannosaminyltransferase